MTAFLGKEEAQGLLLALCLGVTAGRSMDHMKCQEWNSCMQGAAVCKASTLTLYILITFILPVS